MAMVANKKALFVTLMALIHRFEASFSPSWFDSLCLRVTQVPRSPYLVIFVLTTDTTDYVTRDSPRTESNVGA